MTTKSSDNDQEQTQNTDTHPDIIPDLDLLSTSERADLLKKAEGLWDRLQSNDIGGYSDANRPFYILACFRDVIEDYGKRNTGWHHSFEAIEKHRAASGE